MESRCTARFARGFLCVRGVCWIEGNASGAVFPANQPDFGWITCAGSLASRSFDSKPASECDASTVDTESVFHQWPGAGAHRDHHYDRAAAAPLSAICERATCGPRVLRQYLSLVPIDAAASFCGGGLIVSRLYQRETHQRY